MRDLLVAVGMLGLTATAQCFGAESGLVAPPQPNEKCVVQIAGAPSKPEYPESALQSKIAGRVKLEITFFDAQSAPTARSLEAQGPDKQLLVDAATRFVWSYRNLCMKPGDAPVQVRQDFEFVPNDGRKVTWTMPASAKRNADEPTTLAMAGGCVKLPPAKPEMPRKALQRGISGTVVLNIEFLALNEEPKVTVFSPGRIVEFDESAIRFAKGYRLTCGNLPLIATQSFSYRVLDGDLVVLKDMSLKTFVAGSKNATATPVFFDLDRMGCPFDVRMRYWQPHARNGVGEVGGSMPERLAFLDWLAGLQLNLKSDVSSMVMGNELTITVPCGKIDL
jgi:hypothetical protein